MISYHERQRFYFGFGLSITCYLLALAIITWQTAALARSEARRLRALILTLAALYTAIGVLSCISSPLLWCCRVSLSRASSWRLAAPTEARDRPPRCPADARVRQSHEYQPRGERRFC